MNPVHRNKQSLVTRLSAPLATASMVVWALAGSVVHAQPAWKPDKSVEIIIGTTPGGPQDHMGRMLQKVLQDGRWLDVPLNVVNKPGGGGAIGLAYLNQRPGDGRYLMINAPTMISNYIMGKTKFSYADFTPIAVMGIEYEAIFVRADSPLKSGRDLVDRLKKDPTSLTATIGSAIGNSAHLALALAMRAAGVDIKKMKTVVFNSVNDGATALLGGHVDYASSPPSVLMQLVEAGKLRVITITAPQRVGGDLATVPTWKEQGVNATYEVWRGLAGPKGMTPAQVAFWDDVLGKAVKTEDWRKDLERGQVENIYRNSVETGKYWREQHEEVRAILGELGLAN
jgi:putative tricarboxylic transport membrane protein